MIRPPSWPGSASAAVQAMATSLGKKAAQAKAIGAQRPNPQAGRVDTAFKAPSSRYLPFIRNNAIRTNTIAAKDHA